MVAHTSVLAVVVWIRNLIVSNYMVPVYGSRPRPLCGVNDYLVYRVGARAISYRVVGGGGPVEGGVGYSPLAIRAPRPGLLPGPSGSEPVERLSRRSSYATKLRSSAF